MYYKTIVLELLQQQTEMYEQLRKDRKLLTTMESYSRELKNSHEAWTRLLGPLRPGSDLVQIASEALEIAVKGMEDRLSAASSQNDSEALFLDAAMLFLRHPTRRA
jgi:hypothetical protein